MFDWQRFLDSAGVEYQLGPAQNIRKGHLGINCPRCPNDTKKHFSIDLVNNRIRGCWRADDHWIGPVNLIQELGRVSHKEAKRMLKDGDIPVEVDTGDLMRRLERMDQERLPVADPGRLSWPEEFREFEAEPSRRQMPYEMYLRDRGFESPIDVARCYDLRWCDRGEWSHRIMFPLLLNGGLVGWTGRAIAEAKVRYKTHPPGDSVQHLIWGFEPGIEGDWLVVCEGPFDAMKVDWFAGKRRVFAVAVLGLKLGPPKVKALVRAARGFNRVAIILDRGEEGSALRLKEQLGILRPMVVPLEAFKDPGEMDALAVSGLLDSLGPAASPPGLS